MFLPDDYEAPKGANEFYMKLQNGENKIRILSSAIYGWEDWTLERKPVRFRYENKPERSIDPKKPMKHFWAMIVWNYDESRIQILNITQATIRKSLQKLGKDKDWGKPFHYDIKITREGEKMNTDYEITPSNLNPVSQDIIDAYKAQPCNLEALFDNADPFDPKWPNPTPGVFSKDDKVVPIKKAVTEDMSNELAALLNSCKEDYKKKIWDALTKKNISDLKELSLEQYDKLFADAKKNYEENQELPF